MKNIRKSSRIIYLGVVFCSVVILHFVYNSQTQTSQHFILNIAAAFLAFTIALVGFNLSAQHRNRITPYVSIAFLSAGTIDLLNAIFSNDIWIRPTGLIQTYNYVSQFLGQTFLSVMLAVGFTLAVKRSGIWKLAPIYMAGAMVLSISAMLLLSHFHFPFDINPSTFGFYQLINLLPCIGYTYAIIYTFSFNSSLPSQREAAIGQVLVPCLLVLCLAQSLLIFSPIVVTDVLFIGNSLKVLAYLLALIALLHTLWHYGEYSFQIAGTKVSTIFCMMLFALSFLALVEFDRHKLEVLQGTDQVLFGFLEYQHALDKIELGLEDSSLPINETTVDELKSLGSMQEKLLAMLRQSKMKANLSTLQGHFRNLQTIIEDLVNTNSLQNNDDLARAYRELFPMIQQVRIEMISIVDRHHNDLSETKNRKIAAIHRQLVSQLSFLFLLIIGVVAVNRWHNRRLLQPVIHLNDVANRIINDQPTIEPPGAISPRKDELGKLEKSIDQMVKHLQATVNGLEEKVEQRTKALRNSKEQLRSILDNIEEGIITANQQGIIESVNSAACSIFGCSAHQMIGKPVYTLIREEERGAHIHKISQYNDPTYQKPLGKHRRREIGLRPDGSTFPLKISVTEVVKDHHRTFIAVLHDITDEINAENALRQSKQRMSRFFSASIEGLLFYEHGKIIDSNQSAARLLGHTIQEVIGKNITDFFPQENSSRLQNVFDGQDSNSWETEIIQHDGTRVAVKILIRNVEFKGKTLRMAAIRDITQQIQANQALILSETRLKEAQEIAHLGSWELDLVNNELWWSDENYRIFGVDNRDCNTYEAFLNIVHPDDRKLVNTAYTDSVINKTPYSIEHRLLMSDGSVKWVHERCITYYDYDKPLRSVGTTMDITELKQSQIALKKYNKFTSRILDTISSLVFVVDVEGRIVRFNKECEKLTGYAFEDVKGEFVWSILSRSYDQEYLRKHYQTPSPDNFPNKTRIDWPTAKGLIRTIDWDNSVFVDEYGNVEYIIAAGIDVTERLLVERMLEDQLRNLEQKVSERTRELDTMFTLSPDGFVMINNVNNVIFANPAFLEMTGFHVEDVMEISLDAFIRRMLTLCDVQVDIQSMVLDYFINNPILYLQRPIQRVISCIQRDIKDPGGRCVGKVLYYRDITHETEVDRIKSEFLSTAAHEFRTPLSSILGFSELLLSKEYDIESSRKYLEIINRQSNHLKHLLDELLDLARIDARADRDFVMADSTLEEVIQVVIEDTRTFASVKHELKTDFVDEWPLVSFDNEKMQQALMNILSNAYKYSPQGGTISCKTVLKQVGDLQMFGIRIEDQGIGMTPDELNQVGERFYRADTTGTIPGTGLGVSLVKQIIELHHGELEITSTLGQGTQCTIWLPIIPKKTQPVKKSV